MATVPGPGTQEGVLTAVPLEAALEFWLVLL